MEKQSISIINIKRYLNDYVILRPYQIYGPYQKINRLIPLTIKSCISNNNFPCTAGNQLRDFIFVDDFSNLIVKLIKKEGHKQDLQCWFRSSFKSKKCN